MRGYSGVFSFELVRNGFDDVCRVIDALRHFRIAVSWGGVESVVISPARGGQQPEVDANGLPRGLIRLSIGLEGAEVLIADLGLALASPA
jgi:cystathionine beta-lyase/cystathionine gamma-synthase